MPDADRADGADSAGGTAHEAPARARVRIGPRRWWHRLAALAALLVVGGAAVGFTGAMMLTPVYAAGGDVLYSLTREQPTGFLREDRNLSTQLVVLESRTVLDRVAADNGITVDDLAEALVPTIVAESEVVHLELRDTDPVRAEAMLNEIMTRYLEVSNNGSRSDVQDYLDGQLRDVLARLEAIGPEVPTRGAERAALVDREQALRSQLDELALSDLAGPGAEVLVPAYVPTDPVFPQPGFAALTGAFAGLVVAAAVVTVLARRVTRR